MPGSSREGKDWLRVRILAARPTSVLDVGPGRGTYATLLGRTAPIRWICIEIYKPYVKRYHLDSLYDQVIVDDARDTVFPDVDVVILGDVLEHMTLEEARNVWDKARVAAAKAVFLSIPIVDYPQGALKDNEHERHLLTWDHQMVLAELAGITSFATYTQIGVYQADPHRKENR